MLCGFMAASRLGLRGSTVAMTSAARPPAPRLAGSYYWWNLTTFETTTTDPAAHTDWPVRGAIARPPSHGLQPRCVPVLTRPDAPNTPTHTNPGAIHRVGGRIHARPRSRHKPRSSPR